jgi:hypothetical protein
MDDRKPPISQIAPCGRTDAEAAPIDSVGQGSSVVYFCNAEEVSKGFAIALRAMGFDEILPSDLIAQSHATSNPEESQMGIKTLARGLDPRGLVHDDALKLAQGLGAALDKTARTKS